jgi:quercetin dioxygenase-like cupin family protein
VAEFETTVLPEEINGERVIYVAEGIVKIAIDREPSVLLEAGDSVNYKSYVPCRINTDENTRAQIFISGTPPLLIY